MNVPLDWRNVQRQLHSNSSDKLASIAHISTASGEEAGCEPALIEVGARDCMRNSRLPFAGHAVRPEEALPVFAISPSTRVFGRQVGRSFTVVTCSSSLLATSSSRRLTFSESSPLLLHKAEPQVESTSIISSTGVSISSDSQVVSTSA